MALAKASNGLLLLTSFLSKESSESFAQVTLMQDCSAMAKD